MHKVVISSVLISLMTGCGNGSQSNGPAVVLPIPVFNATYVGIDTDKVGPLNSLVPDGHLDNHIKLSNLKTTVYKITVTDSHNLGIWENPFNGGNWNLLAVYNGTNADLYLSTYNSNPVFHIKVIYTDNTVSECDIK